MTKKTNVYELRPYDSHVSFYKKAMIYEEADGSIWLKSYQTFVCRINSKGDFERLWCGYSATTMRHINAFCCKFGIAGGGKAWFESLPVVEEDAEPFSQTLAGKVAEYKQEEERKARFIAGMDKLAERESKRIASAFVSALSAIQTA